MKRKGLRLPARASGIAVFLVVELLAASSLYLLLSIRCCGAGGTPGPQNGAEWAGLAVSLAVLVMLGLVCGYAVALLVEAAHRLLDRLRRRD